MQLVCLETRVVLKSASAYLTICGCALTAVKKLNRNMEPVEYYVDETWLGYIYEVDSITKKESLTSHVLGGRFEYDVGTLALKIQSGDKVDLEGLLELDFSFIEKCSVTYCYNDVKGNDGVPAECKSYAFLHEVTSDNNYVLGTSEKRSYDCKDLLQLYIAILADTFNK